jgi:serine protease AprX
MKTLFISLLFFFSIPLFPQTKYFIYLTDKGINKNVSLKKSAPEYKSALNLLSARSVERRRKVLGDENIVSYDDIPVYDNYVNRITDLGIKIENKLKWFNAVTAYLTPQQLSQLNSLSFISKIEAVKALINKDESYTEKVQPSVKKTQTSNVDYGYSYDQLALSGIPLVHAKGITGKGVVIGLLDSGFDWETPLCFKNAKILGEYDFVFHDSVTANQSQDRYDQDDHGTLVFSTIAGYKPGELIGGAYDAQFYLAKTEYVPTERKVEEDNYAAGLEWLEAKGVDITSSSLGYNEFDSPDASYTYKDMDGKTAIITKALEKAYSLGILTLSAAGNEGNTSWKYITAPADGANVLAVGAVTSSNSLAYFSSIGPTYDGRIKPDITAMGVNVYAAVAGTNNSFAFDNGTSLSTPIACGAAALLLSAYPKLTNVQARKIIIATAGNTSSPDNKIGYGLISASKAVSYPNVEATNNGYKINKIFFSDHIIPTSVNVVISQTSSNFTSNGMNSADGIYYSYPLSAYSANSKVIFYFTYKDSLGNTIREPNTANYAFYSGSTDVFYDYTKTPAYDPITLTQNYPNPFNSKTVIPYTVLNTGYIILKVYNMLGQEVKTLIDGNVQAGEYFFPFNPVGLASGAYIYRLNYNGQMISKKMIYVK